MADRLERRVELDVIVQDWTQGLDAEELLARLDSAEVPGSLVYSVKDLFEDPHVRAREDLVAVPHPLGGLLHMVGIVPKLSVTPGAIAGPGPVEVGAHNEEIYCGRLGLTRADLADLRTRGVV